MSAPRYNPRYTVADYWQWTGDWELWDGLAIAMTPSPFGIHQKLLARLSQRLLNALDAVGCVDCEVAVELDWVISDDTVVRPDVSVLCGRTVERFIESPPTLIVEVLSESTAHKDRTAKFDLYEQLGVRYYVLMDTEQDAYQSYELDSEGAYQSMLSPGMLRLQLHDNCQITLDLSGKHLDAS